MYQLSFITEDSMLYTQTNTTSRQRAEGNKEPERLVYVFLAIHHMVSGTALVNGVVYK